MHRLFYVYLSFGKTTFKMIATKAAGTIPEPPKIKCTISGVLLRIVGFAPIPYPTPNETDTIERLRPVNGFLVIN